MKAKNKTFKVASLFNEKYIGVFDERTGTVKEHIYDGIEVIRKTVMQWNIFLIHPATGQRKLLKTAYSEPGLKLNMETLRHEWRDHLRNAYMLDAIPIYATEKTIFNS